MTFPWRFRLSRLFFRLSSIVFKFASARMKTYSISAVGEINIRLRSSHALRADTALNMMEQYRFSWTKYSFDGYPPTPFFAGGNFRFSSWQRDFFGYLPKSRRPQKKPISIWVFFIWTFFLAGFSGRPVYMVSEL